VVKLAGKQLSPVVYKLITYIEESQKQDPETPKKNKKKNVDSSTLKTKVLRETRLIPKVIYEIEQFSKFVMQLSKKTKVDLSKFVGQGTVRDFRILHLREVLEQANDGAPIEETQGSDTSLIENDNSEEADEEVSPPPTKKRNVESTSD
jgi:Fanconi anemia group I protein